MFLKLFSAIVGESLTLEVPNGGGVAAKGLISPCLLVMFKPLGMGSVFISLLCQNSILYDGWEPTT